MTITICRSPDFISPIGPKKHLERLFNRVVVWSIGCLFATLFIPASSHSKCCPTDQTKPDKMIKMIKIIKKNTKIKKETKIKNKSKFKKETKVKKETKTKKTKVKKEKKIKKETKIKNFILNVVLKI